MQNNTSMFPVKVMVLGASPHPERYSYTATTMLLSHGYEVFPVGIRPGSIAGLPILTDQPLLEGIHTITIYLSPLHQSSVEDYIFKLKPKRVIFNPGTENPDFAKRLHQADILTEEACTLVLLSTGAFMDLPTIA